MRSIYVVVVLVLSQMACAKSNATGDGPRGGAQSINPLCLPAQSGQTRLVTHYYVPLLEAFNQFTCDRMEGTCIYKKNKELWLHNYGYGSQRLSEARCKNGYGNRQNCLNPCRTIAASMRYHRVGEVVFVPALVGKLCGSDRDRTTMVHDGYVVVGDTGAPSHFNAPGRFDFFWGRCRNRNNGVCLEGAEPVSRAASNSDYCMVWNPADPLKNVDLKMEFTRKVKDEAIARGDFGAADDFDLDKSIGPD